MSELLEIVMIVSFGASWPMNVIKSYKARTAKGKSVAFLGLILFGYVAGITGKLLNEACMVNGILPFQDDLRNGDKGIAFPQQILNDTG